MMDVKQFFHKQMISEELSKSKNHGCTLYIPYTQFGVPLDKGQLHSLQQKANVKLNVNLLAIYEKIEIINIQWEIYDKEGNSRDSSGQFKQDEWLIENYLGNEYSWEFVKELLSGAIFLPPCKRLLGLENNSEENYFVVLEQMKIDPKLFCPFDYQSQITALLMRADKKITDNIWILDLNAQKLYDMKIGIEEYLNLAYKAKLFNGWQLVYIHKKKTEHYELMKRFLPKLVPHLKLDLKEFSI